jgi:hypothetical protein
VTGEGLESLLYISTWGRRSKAGRLTYVGKPSRLAGSGNGPLRREMALGLAAPDWG